ncbi:Hypothetical protein CINCED_3A000059 [Cinara cedri]|uniref:Uncharacterized protein n=1 Tax=Cinara cedri TaxID=506608 RepID=A0A5E4NDT6_9HEMI|nr:Hypothetical protein CINCED_3A000059 [Cinara cedri]
MSPRLKYLLSNERTNIDLPENALKEINEECDSAYFLEEEKEEENNDDDDDSEINDESKIKDFKTVISYLEELQKCSATISNSNLLELTTKARECAERTALNHKKQSNIKNYFSKL